MLSLYDSATIQRWTNIINADGISETTWATIATVQCRITDNTTARLMDEEKQRNTSSTTRKMYCDVSVDIMQGDRVIFDGITYMVRSAPYRPRGFSTVHHLKIYLESIEEGKFT